MIKKTLYFIVSLLSVINLTGCASIHSILKPGPAVTAGVEALPPYSGPKAKIVVADFDLKATKAGSDIGQGLRGLLVSALINSNRFLLVERQVAAALNQEQGATAPQKEKSKNADLIITATVAEFEPQSSGGRAGIGGGGGVSSGALGGLLGSGVNQARMALDIRIADASTSEVLSATKIQGQATDTFGSIMTSFFGGGVLSGGLSAYANTPMEKAIRVCMVESVRYISQTIPAAYYKY